jgi:glycosyltransferase involved in cell wall biosynthesis
LKILFIKESRSNTGIEGVGIYLLNVCIELNRLNIPYLVLYNAKDLLYEKMVQNSVNVSIVDLPSGSVKNLISRRKSVKTIRDIILNIVLEEKITCINVHFPHLLNYISSDIDIPVIAHWHGAFIDNNPLKYFYLKDVFNIRMLINNAYKKKYVFNFDRADCVVCPGEAAKNTALNHFQVPEDKIRINPYGIHEINTSLYGDIRKSLGFCTDDRIILSVGRETKSKGAEEFCEVARAFNDRDDVKFVFAGGFTDEIYHDYLINKYGKHVTFLGMRTDVFNLYKSSDVFLFLSHRESAGLVLAEAMFFGLPLITWNIIGVNEMYEDGVQGRMEPFGAIADIIDDINDILNNNELYAQFSEESSKKSKEHLIQKSVKNLINIFNSQ